MLFMAMELKKLKEMYRCIYMIIIYHPICYALYKIDNFLDNSTALPLISHNNGLFKNLDFSCHVKKLKIDHINTCFHLT